MSGKKKFDMKYVIIPAKDTCWCFLVIFCYYNLINVTTDYYRLRKVTTGYNMLLQVTTGYYRLLQVTT